MNNNDKLRALLRESGLTYREFADATGYSIHSVTAWMRPETSKARRDIPDRTLELVEMKIARQSIYRHSIG